MVAACALTADRGSSPQVGSVGAASGGGVRTPAGPVPHVTRYGINANNTREVDARIALCGDVGVARVYYKQMLPASWDPSQEGASPDRACQVSFKANPAEVSAGTYDGQIVGWLNSIPEGWRVYVTFWHEPNDDLRRGMFSSTDFRSAWSRLSGLVRDTARLKAGVDVRLTPVFMAFNVGVPGYWSDNWVPRPDEVDFLSWDIYGNPAGGSGLSGGYPSPQSCIDPCLEATQRLGFDSWGISEFNTPARTWDVDESARRAWLTGFREYAVSTTRTVAAQLGAPRTMLLWVGNGVNWDQTFRSPETWTWWRRVVTSDGTHS